jgi:hypothetical protein
MSRLRLRLLVFLGQNMARMAVSAFELAAGSRTETLCRAFMCFKFWHNSIFSSINSCRRVLPTHQKISSASVGSAFAFSALGFSARFLFLFGLGRAATGLGAAFFLTSGLTFFRHKDGEHLIPFHLRSHFNLAEFGQIRGQAFQDLGS